LNWQDDQIDILADFLDWDIMSGRELSGRVFAAHASRIDWKVFLLNGKPKEINFLVDVADKLTANASVFLDHRVKKRYYNEPFIHVFPQLIDWKWLVKHKKLSEYLIDKFYDKFSASDISKYQSITKKLAEDRIEYINWDIASSRPLSEEVMNIAGNRLNWPMVCRHQKKLSMEFLLRHISHIHWIGIARYQKLAESFIVKYRQKLDMELVSKYQNLSYEFIKEFEKYLVFPALMQNKHYNKKNSIQIVSNGRYYFVIDAPIIGDIPTVLYYD